MTATVIAFPSKDEPRQPKIATRSPAERSSARQQRILEVVVLLRRMGALDHIDALAASADSLLKHAQFRTH